MQRLGLNSPGIQGELCIYLGVIAWPARNRGFCVRWKPLFPPWPPVQLDGVG